MFSSFLSKVSSSSLSFTYLNSSRLFQTGLSFEKSGVISDQLGKIFQSSRETSIDRVPTGFSLSFLGTAGGGISSSRSGPALLVRHAAGSFLINCGEGTRERLLSSALLDAHELKHIFVSQLAHAAGLSSAVRLLGALAPSPPDDAALLTVVAPFGLANQLNLLHHAAAAPLHLRLVDLDPARHAAYASPDGLAAFSAAPSDDPAAEPVPALRVHAVPLPAPRPPSAAASWGLVFREDDGWRFDPQRAAASGVSPALWPLLSQGPLRGPAAPELGGLGLQQYATQRRGRKLVYVGETADPSPLAALAQGADVVVLEAAQGDLAKAQDAAVQFARSVKARHLILTHLPSDAKAPDAAALPSSDSLSVHYASDRWSFDLPVAQQLEKSKKK